MLAGVAARPALAGSTRVAPTCAPSALNRSALLPGTTLTVSPLPDSYDASPANQISLLGAPPSAIAIAGVAGSRSGTHPGHLRAYSQGDGASFVPAKPFQPGETVTVHGRQRRGKSVVHFAFRFTVALADPISHGKPGRKPAAKPGELQLFHSQPALRPPTVSVVASAPQQQPGYIFAAPYAGTSQDGPMIFDSAGNLVWFHPLPLGTKSTNLQLERYEEKPVLTWWQGLIPGVGFGQGEEIVADSSYRQLFAVHAGNGYTIDLHDFHLTTANSGLFTVFNPIHCDLSAVGGPHDSAVTDGIFQEVDLKTRLVRREWHALDHVALSQSYSSPRSASLAWPFDFFHINSVEWLKSRNVLVSSRNTSALYVVNPSTGQVALQVGGKRSTVKMGSGTSTAYQHDSQELPNGYLSVFDNGGVPMVHPQSRGIIVSVNPYAKTDTLVAQYVHSSKPLKSGSQGNMQLLENGDYFIGWGAEPYFTEFTPAGAVVFDARLPGKTQSYRSYRFAWSATPAEPPAIAAENASGTATVYASWNGATDVASWRLLGGASPAALQPLASAPRSGFETAIKLSNAPALVAAQALDAAGNVLATSPTISG